MCLWLSTINSWSPEEASAKDTCANIVGVARKRPVIWSPIAPLFFNFLGSSRLNCSASYSLFLARKFLDVVNADELYLGLLQWIKRYGTIVYSTYVSNASTIEAQANDRYVEGN
jgi:hypothetical protein